MIRIGTNRALGTVTPYISRDKGFYEQQGLQVEIVDFNDVTTLMEAFASGQLDVALVGIAPSAIWQAKGVGLKVVALRERRRPTSCLHVQTPASTM